MKTSRFLNLMIVSLVAMTYTSCSSSDDVIDTPDPIVKTYTMTVDAQKGSNGTRGCHSTALPSTQHGQKVMQLTCIRVKTRLAP